MKTPTSSPRGGPGCARRRASTRPPPAPVRSSASADVSARSARASAAAAGRPRAGSAASAVARRRRAPRAATARQVAAQHQRAPHLGRRHAGRARDRVGHHALERALAQLAGEQPAQEPLLAARSRARRAPASSRAGARLRARARAARRWPRTRASTSARSASAAAAGAGSVAQRRPADADLPLQQVARRGTRRPPPPRPARRSPQARRRAAPTLPLRAGRRAHRLARRRDVGEQHAGDATRGAPPAPVAGIAPVRDPGRRAQQPTGVGGRVQVVRRPRLGQERRVDHDRLAAGGRLVDLAAGLDEARPGPNVCGRAARPGRRSAASACRWRPRRSPGRDGCASRSCRWRRTRAGPSASRARPASCISMPAVSSRTGPSSVASDERGHVRPARVAVADRRDGAETGHGQGCGQAGAQASGQRLLLASDVPEVRRAAARCSG